MDNKKRHIINARVETGDHIVLIVSDRDLAVSLFEVVRTKPDDDASEKSDEQPGNARGKVTILTGNRLEQRSTLVVATALAVVHRTAWMIRRAVVRESRDDPELVVEFVHLGQSERTRSPAIINLSKRSIVALTHLLQGQRASLAAVTTQARELLLIPRVKLWRRGYGVGGGLISKTVAHGVRNDANVRKASHQVESKISVAEARCENESMNQGHVIALGYAEHGR
jgi:hypothetical protein